MRTASVATCHVSVDVILAVAKPEVYVSPVVGELDAKFQMFFDGFQGRPTELKWFRPCHVTADVTFSTWRLLPPVPTHCALTRGILHEKRVWVWGLEREPPRSPSNRPAQLVQTIVGTRALRNQGLLILNVVVWQAVLS